MKTVDYEALISEIVGTTIDRTKWTKAGTLSDHAAGEPFEKFVYQYLKTEYPEGVFKQHDFQNDLYLKNPQVVSLDERNALFNSPTALFLLNYENNEAGDWTPQNIFEEKQNDTADILYHAESHFELIDVKTRNISKNSQPPNIISAYKLAKACAYMIDNEEFDNIGMNYIEVDWIEDKEKLMCCDAHYGNLFKSNPTTLYINWAAAMQIQFHVCDLDQTWKGTRMKWATEYIRIFVNSARHRVRKMEETYITPFLKYIQ